MAAAGTDQRYGARHLKRAIERKDGSGCISNRLCRPLVVAATLAKIGKVRSYATEGA
jgi:hypothetical protein